MASRARAKRLQRQVQQLQRRQQVQQVVPGAAPLAHVQGTPNGGAITTTQVMAATSYSGPIPSPEDLAAYAQIQPDLAGRIVSMAERQAAHRQKLESRALWANILQNWFSTFCALLVALGGFALAGYAVHKDHPWIAATVSAFDIGGLVSVFVYGRRRETTVRVAVQPEKQ